MDLTSKNSSRPGKLPKMAAKVSKWPKLHFLATNSARIKEFFWQKSFGATSFRNQSGLCFFIFAKGVSKNPKYWILDILANFWRHRLAFFSFFSIFFFLIFWKLYAYWVWIWPQKNHPGLQSGLKWLQKFQNVQQLHFLASNNDRIKKFVWQNSFGAKSFRKQSGLIFFYFCKGEAKKSHIKIKKFFLTILL